MALPERKIRNMANLKNLSNLIREMDEKVYELETAIIKDDKRKTEKAKAAILLLQKKAKAEIDKLKEA